MDRPRQENRDFKGIPVGVGIRGTIGSRKAEPIVAKIYRMRRYPTYWTQDRYDYFVPDSIVNPESEPYRRQWIAAVHKWRYDLTAGQKKEYNDRAGWRLRISGFNLFMHEAMKGLVEMYVDRGDPAAYDYDKDDLVKDGTWQDLDLSLLVPAGAKIVFIIGHVEGNGIDWKIMFRKKGNVNEINHGGMETIRANVERHRSSKVSLDVNRVIQYKADNQAWVTLDLAVRGWWT